MSNDFTVALTNGFKLVPKHDIRNVQGAPGWFELTTAEPDQACAFLGALFGWQFQTIQFAGGDYRVILLQGHQIGGIKQPLPGEPETPQWATYVTVADVDEIAERAVGVGAELVVPPTDLGDAGRLAVVAHPAGGRLLAFEYPGPFS